MSSADKPEATCLLTGAMASPAGASPLVGRFSTEDTHTHVMMLHADEPESKVISAMTDSETLAHMYGVSPSAIDLLGITGVEMISGTTEHSHPVGITFATADPTTGEFKPIETLTRATFQMMGHNGKDAGQLAHYVCMPSRVGFTSPSSTIRFNEATQVPDSTATNMALRQWRWPHKKPMVPEGGYNEVMHETLGTLHAVPLATGSSMAECNVSHLLSTNIDRISTICGDDAKVVTTAAGMKYAMVPDQALKKVTEQLESSFETRSCLNGGLRVTAYPLAGGPMEEGCSTTVCFKLIKPTETVAARCAAAMTGDGFEGAGSHIETVTSAHIAPYLGETGDGATVAALAAPLSKSQLVSELSTLAHN